MSAPSRPPVAASLAALDAAWFGRVLREGGHCSAKVSAVAVEPLKFTGATTDMARVRLHYAGTGTPGPASLIAKIRGADEFRAGMDAVMGLYAREARFYTEFAQVVPLRAPRCYHAGDGSRTPLLLEDLGGLRSGDQMQGITLTDAQRVMDALADLHAAYWGSRAAAANWLVQPASGAYAGLIVQLVGSGVDQLCRRFQGRVPKKVLDAVARLAPRWGDVLRAGAEGPQTIAHNDCRLDNLFFDSLGEPVFVDWQIIARTRGTQDVGNLLAGSMDIDALDRHWEALLRRYHQRLCANGVGGYGWDECRAHYRQNIVYPLGAGIALLGQLDIGDSRGLGDAIILRALHHGAALDAFDSF